MEYQLDYIKRDLRERKYLNANSNFEVLTEVLELVRLSEGIEIVRLENLMTGELLINKPDLALDMLDQIATGIIRQLDTEIIELAKKKLIF